MYRGCETGRRLLWNVKHKNKSYGDAAGGTSRAQALFHKARLWVIVEVFVLDSVHTENHVWGRFLVVTWGVHPQGVFVIVVGTRNSSGTVVPLKRLLWMRVKLDEIEYSHGSVFLEGHDDAGTFGMSWSSYERMEGCGCGGCTLASILEGLYKSVQQEKIVPEGRRGS